LLFALIATPAVARAQISDADRATARSLAVEGQEALDRKDFPTALDRFHRADAIIHAPTLLLGVARAQVGMGQWIAAQESYNRILREGAPEGSPEPFFEALDAARKELDALAPRIPQVLITVQGADAAEVTIDGEPVPRAAIGVKRPVDPGTHIIRAKAEGRAPVMVEVEVAEGTTREVPLELWPIVRPSSAARPRAPVVTLPPPDAGATAPGDGRMMFGVAALGLGGLGLAVGGVAGVFAMLQHGDLTEACPDQQCDPSLQGDIDSYHTLGTVSTVAFAVGAASAGVGAYLLLSAPKSPARAQISISPVIGLGHVGAMGRF
jgi:hypothetical protein